LDRLFLKRLSRKFPVLLTAVRLPEDLPRYQVLPKREVRAEVWALPNPVEETRHLLRALKRALAPRELGGEGLDPFEVLVVAPEERIPGLLLLKEEYGLPLFDGREAALSALEGGERLLALLNPHPTGADLLLLGFEALGRKALRLGLVGLPALEKLAGEEGLEGSSGPFWIFCPKTGWGGRAIWSGRKGFWTGSGWPISPSFWKGSAWPSG
jgi:ATP-dependent helicase/nuclease subunit B